MDSSYASSFRSDLKNLKIKTFDGTECKILYFPKYGSQDAAILVRIPIGKISETTKLILEVHDTTFSSTLSTGGDLLMFDANSDTYSNFFMEYSGLSINNDSTDGWKFLRARFAPSFDSWVPNDLFTTFTSGQDLSNNRVTVIRFKHIDGNVAVNDNGTYPGTTVGSYMMQSDFNLTTCIVETDMPEEINEIDYLKEVDYNTLEVKGEIKYFVAIVSDKYHEIASEFP